MFEPYLMTRFERSARYLPRLGAWLLLITLSSGKAWAHEGEDHSQDSQAPNRPATSRPATNPHTTAIPTQDLPARLADGSVFLPKASQNLLGVRTVRVHSEALQRSVELAGQIQADPSAGGLVQATQAGRIVPGARGLPALGSRVKAGDILAWLEPVGSSTERGNLLAQVAALQAQQRIAEQRVARHRQLEGLIPGKEVAAARIELQGLRQQRSALAAALHQRQALTAPVAGVISQVQVVAGQVVEPRQSLFEIVHPERLMVAARGHDPSLLGQISAASGTTASGQTLRLSWQGSGLSLQQQALPIHFRIVEPDPQLVVGMPVKVFVALGRAEPGLAVPQQAVVKGSQGDTMVWVHTSAERFTPVRVQVAALDAQRVLILSGLKGGERVVTQGTLSLSQIR